MRNILLPTAEECLALTRNDLITKELNTRASIEALYEASSYVL